MTDPRPLTHSELVGWLAAALDWPDGDLGKKRFAMEEVTLGPGGSPAIADVMFLRGSFSKPYWFIYECKVTRSDFLSDVRSEKYKKYFPFCNYFAFACPTGLIKQDEIPADCGLTYISPDGNCRAVKVGRWRPIDLDALTMKALCLRIVFKIHDRKEAKRRLFSQIVPVEDVKLEHRRREYADLIRYKADEISNLKAVLKQAHAHIPDSVRDSLWGFSLRDRIAILLKDSIFEINEGEWPDESV